MQLDIWVLYREALSDQQLKNGVASTGGVSTYKHTIDHEHSKLTAQPEVS
jgi:hypothetical protein